MDIFIYSKQISTVVLHSYHFSVSSLDNRQAIDEIAKELVMAERAKGNKLSMTDAVGKA